MRSSRALVVLGAGILSAAPEWRLQYFHDEDESSLTITDLAFPTPRRGIACGLYVSGGKGRPALLVTSDGGARWAPVAVKEPGTSLFFLNDSIGWMVTSQGVWQTEEGGMSWRKTRAPGGVRRVYFLNERRGFAAGVPKAVWETSNGGQEWKKVDAAAKAQSNPEYTSYDVIEFLGDRLGIIAGSSRPPRREQPDLPVWVDPDAYRGRREWPALTITLETRDGGTTWTPAAHSLFGRVSRFRMRPEMTAVLLLQYLDDFEFPAELYRLDMKTGKSVSILRRKDRVLTDVVVVSASEAYVAAIGYPGSLRRLPVPGRLHILHTRNLEAAAPVWEEMQVDYRATAARAVLAAPLPGELWAATDTGMILKLETKPKQ